MARTIAAAVIVLLVLPALLLSGCGSTEAPAPEMSKVPIIVLSDQMSVHEFAGDVVQSIAVISGTARNDSSQTIESAYIQANYYDKQGNMLGSASAIIANLAPGAIWNFTIEFKGADSWKAATYDLSISTGTTP
jgi:hypothetical protein